MKTPRLSVIMPLFNAEKFVDAAIESVLGQTFADFELIVIDDGSSDQSLEVVQRFGDARIRLIHNGTNLGAARSRNSGIAQARGELIAFLDSDDVAYPSRFETQIGRLGSGFGIVGSRTHTIDGNDRIAGTGGAVVASDEIPSTLLFENCLMQSTVLLRRSILDGGDLFRTAFEPAEDYELWTRLTKKTKTLIVSKPLVRYRDHASGISKRRTERMEGAVRSIITQELAALGVEPQIDLHRQLAQWPLDATPGQLQGAGDWLETLLRANRRSNHFDSIIFERVVARRWYLICRDSWQLGWKAWRIYRDSPLARSHLRENATLLRRVLPRAIAVR